ncbi:MAG: (2Fe-2S)-binding protein [Saprospiraceae bacterium]
MKTSFKLNGKQVQVETAADATLLWTLRDTLHLTGTKFGCGAALCGACTVHLDGVPVKSCLTSVSAAAGRTVTTIEGLSTDKLHPLQQAWIDEQVPQCGYCQSGQIMQAAALLKSNPHPNREEIINHMNTVLCRCGTYLRIIKAIERASTVTSKSGKP